MKSPIYFYGFDIVSRYQNYSKYFLVDFPDSKVHEANMGPIWGRQDPDGPYVGPMNFAIWVTISHKVSGAHFELYMPMQWGLISFVLETAILYTKITLMRIVTKYSTFYHFWAFLTSSYPLLKNFQWTVWYEFYLFCQSCKMSVIDWVFNIYFYDTGYWTG